MKSSSPPIPTPPAPNLLPPEFLAAKHKRRRLRSLAISSALYLVSLGAACAVVRVATAPAGESDMTELARLQSQHASTAESLDRVELQLRALRTRLDARKSLASQPDFSLLLELLGTCVDAEIAVRQFQLRATGVDPTRSTVDLPRASSNGSGASAVAVQGAEREPRHFTLTLRGAAASEGAISRFTQRLRSAGVFDAVNLKRTGRLAAGTESLSGGTARASDISYEIECLIIEPTIAPDAPGRPGKTPVATGSSPANLGGPR